MPRLRLDEDVRAGADAGPDPGDAGLKHSVIDTSRNGQGPWAPTVSYPDKQDWCNPPDRGLGYQPTANTGAALVDAYLWIKIPGESDGTCTRGLGPAGLRLGDIQQAGPRGRVQEAGRDDPLIDKRGILR